ncbi:MAG: ABC transporter ATP-binding protein [Deltaproteobacteria bacterium]|nr:ABC transporter ATP-binding protein [Deltaproteobacteria bacterium]
MSHPELLKVTHLTKTFGSFTAVKDLSFSIGEGEIVGFLGQNGAGKSTTIKMLSRLIKPTSGDILLRGTSILTSNAESRRKIGVIVESPRFFPHLSGYKNLELLARIYQLPNTRVEELLERVGISHAAQERFGRYSMGMKQRLGLAAVLLNHPELIILDEPTNGLDPVGSKQIRDLIKDLVVENNVSVLISTHMLDEVAFLCNRAMIIHKGELMLEHHLHQRSDIKKIEDTFAEIAAKHIA